MKKLFKKLIFQALMIQALACMIATTGHGTDSGHYRAPSEYYSQEFKPSEEVEIVSSSAEAAPLASIPKKASEISPAPLGNEFNYCYFNAQRQLAYAALTAYPELYKYISKETRDFFTQSYAHHAMTRTVLYKETLTRELDEIIQLSDSRDAHGTQLIQKIDYKSLNSLIQDKKQEFPHIIYVEDCTKIPQSTTLTAGNFHYKLKGIITFLYAPNTQIYPQWDLWTHYVAHIELNKTWFHCSDDTVEELGSSYKKAQKHLETVGGIINHGLLYIRQN